MLHLPVGKAGAISQSSAAAVQQYSPLQRPCIRRRNCSAGRQLQKAVSNGAKCRAFFKFKNPLRGSSEDAGIYGSQSRDDYSADDVEHYFNYMGMLAIEGTYDRLNSMLAQGLAPVDLLLLMAARENDAPKVAELLRAGASTDVKGTDGKSAADLASTDEVKALLSEPAKAFSF